MPEFERDAYGPIDAYEAQLKHYGIKEGRTYSPTEQTTLPASTRLGDSTGMPVPSRKPVQKSDAAGKMPTRKPVPGSDRAAASPAQRAASPASRTASPAPRGRSSVPRDRAPSVTINTIFRGADGRFDPSTIRQVEHTPSAGFTPPASPSHPPSRPSSRSSWRLSMPKMKRTDSNASNSSNTSKRSRRESVTHIVRRFSNAMNIVKMDKHGRQTFSRGKDAEKLEERHRSGSISRVSLQSNGGPGKPRPGELTRGERLALNISRPIDPLKARGRKGTNESDMSFGMTDKAPAGTMQQCDECGLETSDYLVGGLCKECHEAEAKILVELRNRKGKDDDEGLSRDPWQSPQGRSTWPDVGSPEHGFIKLPDKHKLIRIRQTIYEDPGNPFADEVQEEQGPQAFAPEKTSGHDTSNIEESFSRFTFHNENPFALGGSSIGATQPSSQAQSMPWTIRAPVGRSQGTASIIQAHRRSKSVAVPLASPATDSEEYVAPRRFWRERSAPTHPPVQKAVSDDARDTKFYGFYDDIMRDYRRKSQSR